MVVYSTLRVPRLWDKPADTRPQDTVFSWYYHAYYDPSIILISSKFVASSVVALENIVIPGLVFLLQRESVTCPVVR
jgi:hypothetical protein